MAEATTCALCGGATTPFAPSPATHVDCSACGLVTLRRELHPTADAELARYRLHENSPDDPGYRAFLARLVEPLVAAVTPGSEGLDFGCGPGPTLSVMLRERGLACALHDALFSPNPGALARTWDFVACTEVVEHFREPAASWRELLSLVRPGGVLGVMTQPLTGPREARFTDWAYARDPTHLALHRPRTLDWLARAHDMALTRPRQDCWLMTRR